MKEVLPSGFQQHFCRLDPDTCINRKIQNVFTGWSQKDQKGPFGRSAYNSFQNSLSSPLRLREDGGESESRLRHSALPGPPQHPQSLELTQSFSGGRGERLPLSAHKHSAHPSHLRSRASHSLSPGDQKMTLTSDILVGNICFLASLSFPLLRFNFSFHVVSNA